MKSGHAWVLLGSLIAGGGTEGWSAAPPKPAKLLETIGRADCLDALPEMWATRFTPLAGKRTDHALVALTPTTVMVVGGSEYESLNGDWAVATCEAVDVKTGTPKSLASLAGKRRGLGACRTPDGLVWALGGVAGGAALASVERYDPSKDRWEAMPPMHDARAYFGLAVLRDGRLLVAGGAAGNGDVGQDGKGTVVNSSEVYDPRAKAWIVIPMRQGRATAGLVQLQDGRVLMFGGRKRADTTGFPGHGGHLFSGPWKTHRLDSAELFDPTKQAWTKSASMPSAHYACRGTLLSDGRVLAFALPWMSRERGEGDAELYDPAKDRWTTPQFERINGRPWLSGKDWNDPVPMAYGTFGQLNREGSRLRHWNPSWRDQNDYCEEAFYSIAADAEAVPLDATHVLRVGGVWSAQGVNGVWILARTPGSTLVFPR